MPVGRERMSVTALCVLTIIAVGAAVYANTLGGQYLWDDIHLVENNAFIRDAARIPEMFAADVGAGAGEAYRFYRPLQVLTYLIDNTLWRGGPAGHHLGNIFWHVMSALALFALVRSLFGDRLLAFVTGLLFVVHPVHTEAVAYISSRADPLSTFFILLTMLLYFAAVQRQRAFLFLASLLAYAAALLSKENSLIVVPLLLVCHSALRRPARAAYLTSLSALAVVYVILRFTLFRGMLAQGLAPSTLLERLPGFFEAWAAYLRVLVAPFHLHMEYGLGASSFQDPRVVLGFLVFAALLFIIVHRKDRRGLLFFGPAWFVVALLPVSNLYPVNAYMAEHWLYLPSVGFFLLVAGAFTYAMRRERARVAAWAGLVLLTGFWGTLTVRQNATWLEPIAFYQRLLHYAPFSSRLHNALGMAYNRRGEREKGLPFIEKAAALSRDASPRDAVRAYTNLAYAYDGIGKHRDALRAAQKALGFDPEHVKAYNNKAVTLIRLGRFDEALEACRKALKIEPRNADVLNTMGAAYVSLGRLDEALDAYRKVTQADPDYPMIAENIALVETRKKMQETE